MSETMPKIIAWFGAVIITSIFATFAYWFLALPLVRDILFVAAYLGSVAVIWIFLYTALVRHFR